MSLYYQLGKVQQHFPVSIILVSSTIAQSLMTAFNCYIRIFALIRHKISTTNNFTITAVSKEPVTGTSTCTSSWCCFGNPASSIHIVALTSPRISIAVAISLSTRGKGCVRFFTCGKALILTNSRRTYAISSFFFAVTGGIVGCRRANHAALPFLCAMAPFSAITITITTSLKTRLY